MDLSLAYAGYAIDLLNELPVVDAPPSECTTGKVIRPAGLDGSHWYQRRILSWTRCDDGSMLVFLPESGWMMPTEVQRAAVEASFD